MVSNQLVFATITPFITGTIHVFTSLVEVETFIAPKGRLTPPQILAAVSSEGSWRGSEDEEERRCYMTGHESDQTLGDSEAWHAAVHGLDTT